jgi:hypothetical protein
MATLREAYLDDYSQVALPLILARFPEWEPFAKVSCDTVEFNIPCPSPVIESGLWVSTADEELSVGFHTYHRHFTNYEDRIDLTQIEAGLEFAVAILEDRIGVLSYYCGKKFSGSGSVDLPYPATLPKLYGGMGLVAKVEDFFGGWDRVMLRSWSGRFDRDEQA